MGRAQGVKDNFSDVLGKRRGSSRQDQAPKPIYKKYVNDEGQEVEEYRAWENGPLHRKDGPAVITVGFDGLKYEEYFINGVRHREDGPAIVISSLDGTSTVEYIQDNKRHRLGAPAVIITQATGAEHQEWWENGEYLKIEIVPPNKQSQ